MLLYDADKCFGVLHGSICCQCYFVNIGVNTKIFLMRYSGIVAIPIKCSVWVCLDFRQEAYSLKWNAFKWVCLLPNYIRRSEIWWMVLILSSMPFWLCCLNSLSHIDSWCCPTFPLCSHLLAVYHPVVTNSTLLCRSYGMINFFFLSCTLSGMVCCLCPFIPKPL